jgi:hypothetical protein
METSMTQLLPSQCYQKEQVAAFIAGTPRTAAELMRRGKIRSLKVGKRRVATGAAIIAFIKREERSKTSG